MSTRRPLPPWTRPVLLGASRVLARRGEMLRMLGRYEDALAALDEALGLSPDDAWAWANRGETLRMLGRYEEALAALDKAVGQSPDDALTLFRKGDLLYDIAEYKEALDVINRAIDRDPENAWVFHLKGRNLLISGSNMHRRPKRHSNLPLKRERCPMCYGTVWVLLMPCVCLAKRKQDLSIT